MRTLGAAAPPFPPQPLSPPPSTGPSVGRGGDGTGTLGMSVTLARWPGRGASLNPPGRAHSSCAQQGPDVDAHPGSQPPGEKLCSSAASGFSTARAGPAAGRWGLLLLSRWEVPPAAPHTLFCQPFTSLQRLRTRRDSTHSAFRAGLGPSHSPGSRGGGGASLFSHPVPFTRVPAWG